MEILSNSLYTTTTTTSYSSSASATTIGGRAIDRHNPIITDEKRSGFTNSCTNTPIRTPLTNNTLQKKPTTPTPQITTPKPPLKKKGNTFLFLKLGNTFLTFTRKSRNRKATDNDNNNNNNHHHDHDDKSIRSFPKPSDLIMKAETYTNFKPGVDYFTPSESSRYLLDDTSFLEILSDFDPVLKIVPRELNYSSRNNNAEVLKSESSKPLDQVVVLRVSLHCRGCEKKMKKHLSRMAGVKSFNIDFAAKKVTVVGDVTPLEVLASISKVKTAQLWIPTTQSSSQMNYSKNMK